MIPFFRRIALKPNAQMAVGLMWSFSALLVKDLTNVHGLDIFFISACRSLVGFAFILPLFLGDKRRSESAPSSSSRPATSFRVFLLMLLGGCALAANSFLLCWAFQHTSALTPVFMHYSGLILVVPASIAVFHYFPTRSEWFASALTVTGLLALVFHGLAFDKTSVVVVSLCVGVTQFAGQLCIAWLSKDDEKAKRDYGINQSNAGKCFLICELLTIVVGLCLSQAHSLSHVDTTAMLEIVLLGTVTWGLPNLLALLAVRTKEIASLSLLWLADPIFVSFWPVAFGQDPPPPLLAWLGGLLIFAALLIQRAGQVKNPIADSN